MRRGLLAVLIASLLAVGQAGAVDYTVGYPPQPWLPVTSPHVYLDLAVARDYWHATPDCPQGYAVYENDLSHVLGGDGALGLAPQPGCVMWLSSVIFEGLDANRDTTAVTARADRAEACLLVVHEWGHSLGRGHTQDPRSVMNPAVAQSDPFVVPGCAAQLHAPKKAQHRHRRPTRTRSGHAPRR